jgi:hypothetical protein
LQSWISFAQAQENSKRGKKRNFQELEGEEEMSEAQANVE